MRIRPEVYVALVMLAICGGVYAGLPASERRLTTPEAGEVAGDYDGWRLVVFETANCGWCRKLRAELAPPYRSTSYQAVAPLTFVTADRRGIKVYTLKSGVTHVPTLVLVDPSGREVSRFPGYPQSTRQLYDFVGKHL